MYIVFGHFVQVSTSNRWLLALLKQHNMIVGCFFVLSGFVLAIGHKGPAFPKTLTFMRKRLSRIYWVYLFVLVLFAPMFVFIDRSAGSGNLAIAGHAAIVLTLLQAWSADWGLLWNSPTWFLSAWVFANCLFPISYRITKPLVRKQLLAGIGLIFSLLLLIRIYYTEKIGLWGIEELRPDLNWPVFNFFRFHPLFNSLEFFAGLMAGHIFKQNRLASRLSSFYVWTVGAVLLGIVVLRLWFPVNELLSRSFFMPLFLVWIYFLSFETSSVSKILSKSFFVYLGNLSFCIYVLHGALGQLFYKRIVRTWLAHDAPPFYGYLISLLVGAIFLRHLVEKPFWKK